MFPHLKLFEPKKNVDGTLEEITLASVAAVDYDRSSCGSYRPTWKETFASRWCWWHGMSSVVPNPCLFSS